MPGCFRRRAARLQKRPLPCVSAPGANARVLSPAGPGRLPLKVPSGLRLPGSSSLPGNTVRSVLGAGREAGRFPPGGSRPGPDLRGLVALRVSGRRDAFAGMHAGRPQLRVCRHALSHAEEPARQRIVVPDRPRLMDQHEERGLEGVFRIVGIAEHATANAQAPSARAGSSASNAASAP